MTMDAQLNCVIRWGREFVNIAGVVDNNCVLFSVRPPEGARNGWTESRREPPRPVYMRSDGSRMDDPQQPTRTGVMTDRPITSEE